MIKKRPKGDAPPSKSDGYEAEMDDAEDDAEEVELDGPALMEKMHKSCKAGDYEGAFEALRMAVDLAAEEE